MLETPSIRRYSFMSQPFCRVVARVVKIRSVRTISRKGPVPLTGWIGSLMTWATGSRDSSMEREASTSQSVESVTVDFHGASRCRSTCRRSVKKHLCFSVRSSALGRCEAVVTVSSTTRSPSQSISKSGSSRSSIGSYCEVRSREIFGSSGRSLNLSCQADICQQRVSRRPSF
jgi:hypothetical protein